MIDEIEEMLPFDVVVKTMCKSLKSKHRDPHEVDVSAVASALVETINERLGSTNQSTSVVMPAALFASAFSALSSTLESSTHTSMSSTLFTQLALTKILCEVIPYVSTSNPNLYANQFPALSRTLRAIVTSIPASPSIEANGESCENLGVWDSLLRSTMRTTAASLQGVLQLDNALSLKLEKQVLKCYQAVILQQFDDYRAKVRREAHAVSIEILVIKKNDVHVIHEGKSSIAPVNQIIGNHLVEYSHHILSSISKEEYHNQRNYTQILHLLSFLDNSITNLPTNGIYILIEDLVKIILAVTKKTVSGEDKNCHGITLINATLTVMISCLDSNHEGNKDYYYMNESSLTFSRQLVRIAEKILAFMIQINASLVSSATASPNTNAGGECLVLYSRLLVSYSIYLHRVHSSSGTSSHSFYDSSNKDDAHENSFATVTKLLPLCIQSVLKCISGDSNTFSQGICSELTRLTRSCLPIIFQEQIEENQCILDCTYAIKEVLNQNKRIHWNSSLPCLVSMITTIVHNIVPYKLMNNSSDYEQNEKESTCIARMKTVIQPLMESLLLLHSDAKDETSRKIIELATKNIIEAIGVELFFIVTDLSKEEGNDENTGKTLKTRDEVAKSRVWTLDVLKRAFSSNGGLTTSGYSGCPYKPRLKFFQNTVLQYARKCDGASARKGIPPVEKSILRDRVLSFWCLFPSFCDDPSDFSEIFPSMSQTFVKAMNDSRYPQLTTIICTGLTRIANSVDEKSYFNTNISSDKMKNYKQILSDISMKMLPLLFRTVEKLNGTKACFSEKHKNSYDDMEVDDKALIPQEKKFLAQNSQQVISVIDAIAAYAPLSPAPFLQNLFKKLMQRLLKATTNEHFKKESETACSLLGISRALVKSKALDETSISLLYRAIRPLLRSDELSARIQKNAYKVFLEVCHHHTSFINNSDRLKEMLELMSESIMTLHVPARYMRLRCMTYAVEGFESKNDEQMNIIRNITCEVLLSLKDSNGKTREAAYQLLISMAKVRKDMLNYFEIIVGALGARTPHMRSAAVMALSRLVFEFSRNDANVQSFLPSLLETVIVLFNEKSREVIKSVVAFVRVTIAAIDKSQLKPLLPNVVGGLMKFNKGNDRFRSKIKIILKKLVRDYGYDTITPLVPEGDLRLLTHMRKLAERMARRKAQGREDGNVSVKAKFDDLVDSDEYESDCDKTLMTGMTGLSKMTCSNKISRSTGIQKNNEEKSVRSRAYSTKSFLSKTAMNRRIAVKAETQGEVLDMLDETLAKNLQFNNDENHDIYGSDDDDDDNMEFANDGRLIINDDDSKNSTIFKDEGLDDEQDRNENNEIFLGVRKRRKLEKKFEDSKVVRTDMNLKKNKKFGEKKENITALGHAYKSKKSGGDVKKKGQSLDPYAYIPLDGKSYTKKNRNKSVSQMATVVRDKRKRKRK